MHRCSVAFILSLLAGACVAPESESAPKTSQGYQPIVGGTVDNGDPAVPAIYIGGGLCTGTLISPHVILTAGHCISPANQTQVDFNGTVIQAVATQDHQTGDIGLIAMQSAGPVAPIPIAREPLDNHIGELVRIVGFGVTCENCNDSDVKRQGTATLDHVTLEEGGLVYTTNDPQGTCYGDSGGPNFMMINGVEVVAGETTTGTDICGSGLDIGVRIDTFTDWIDAFVAQYDGAATCNGDGQCATGCADPDPDCPCADDGYCTAACTNPDSDPDCDGLPPDAGTDPGGDDDTTGDDAPADGDQGTGCCSAGGDTPVSAGFLGLLAILVLRRRRK